jgi:hypothetical protein
VAESVATRRTRPFLGSGDRARSACQLFVFPAHALLIVEERLREQEAEGVEMPDMPREELALRDPNRRVAYGASLRTSAPLLVAKGRSANPRSPL